MNVSISESINMIGTCVYLSTRNNQDASMSEPDDSLELYLDFLEKINSADWINDFYLLELIDNLFQRRTESPTARDECQQTEA
jgi:hypothetical protein